MPAGDERDRRAEERQGDQQGDEGAHASSLAFRRSDAARRLLAAAGGAVGRGVVADAGEVAAAQHRDRRGVEADEVGRRVVVAVELGLVVHRVFGGGAARAQRDVLGVVLDGVGLAELPRAVDQGEQERRDARR